MQTSLLDGGARPRKQSEASKAAERFAFQLRAHRIPGWIREHKFAANELGCWPKDPRDPKPDKGRKWAFDFANPDLMLAVEIEGLRVQKIGGRTVCTGRHSTVDGYREDCRKYAAAVELGWHVLRFVQDQVRNGEAIATVERVLARRGWRRDGATSRSSAEVVAAPHGVPPAVPRGSQQHGD